MKPRHPVSRHVFQTQTMVDYAKQIIHPVVYEILRTGSTLMNNIKNAVACIYNNIKIWKELLCTLSTIDPLSTFCSSYFNTFTPIGFWIQGAFTNYSTYLSFIYCRLTLLMTCGRSRRDTFRELLQWARWSSSSDDRPTWTLPSITPTVAGVAPSARTMASTSCAVLDENVNEARYLWLKQLRTLEGHCWYLRLCG